MTNADELRKRINAVKDKGDELRMFLDSIDLPVRGNKGSMLPISSLVSVAEQKLKTYENLAKPYKKP